MPGEMGEFFGPLTTKQQACKMFLKLNWNHFLMGNVLKIHKYQTFALMGVDNLGKIWFANNKFSL